MRELGVREASGRGRATGTPMKTLHKSLFGPGSASPGRRTQEVLQVVEQVTGRKDDSPRSSKVMTRAQKARAERAPKPAPEGKAGDGICHLDAPGGWGSRGAGTG